MSPFVLIALAALLGFVVGWFAHGPKEASPQISGGGASSAPSINPLSAELDRLKQQLVKLETHNAGLEAMVHGRDATLTDILHKAADQS